MSRKFVFAMLFVLLFAGILTTPLHAGSAPDPLPATTLLAQNEETTPTETEPVTLAEGLTNIFAILGLYIVTMFTMAIGTEIMVDVVKIGIGLKSKPTARETMAAYKDLLPGSLESLGASVKIQQEFAAHLVALETVLKPVEKAEEFLMDVRQGEIGKVVQTVLTVVNAGTIPSETEAKQWVIEQMHNGITNLTNQLELPATLAHILDTRVRDVLAALEEVDPVLLLSHAVNILQGNLAELVIAWTRQQIGAVSVTTSQLLKERYYSQLRPQLEGFGLNREELQAIDGWLSYLLQALEKDGQISREVEIYLNSLTELLKGVETQRDLLSSPARRFWRWLRGLPVIGPNLIVGMERAWNRLLQHDPAAARPDYSQLTPTTAARIILQEQGRHEEEAKMRVKWLRFTSVVVGIGLAYILRLDSGDLLRDLLPMTDILTTGLTSDQTVTILGQVAHLRPLTPGIILTGLAASAGSGFWHDQLTRLRTAKNVSEEVVKAVQKIQS